MMLASFYRNDSVHPGPLVSVIVIFLDAEGFLREAIESVFSQTYRRWELLLVDDGSNDGSTAMARRYAERFSAKVRYLNHEHHENRGMSASRNLGLRHAAGELVAFLDADDIWLPHKLEQQVKILAERPEAAMVYGPTQWWYSWTGRAEDRHRDFIHELGVRPNTLIRPPGLLLRFLPAEGISPCTCSVLIRSRIIKQVGGFEESFRGMYEDQAFFAKLCLTAPIFVTGDCTARYRQHPASQSSSVLKGGQYEAARRAFLEWLEGYLLYHIMDDPAVWRALRRERFSCRHPHLSRLARRVANLAKRVYGRLRRAVPGKLGSQGKGADQSSRSVEHA